MSYVLLDGRAAAREVRRELAEEVADFREAEGVVPGLAIILIGDDPASEVYVRNKLRECEKVGMKGQLHHFPGNVGQGTVETRIRDLNHDESIHGIIIQWPVPGHLDFEAFIDALAPVKDVDGFHPHNIGRLWEGRPRYVPATPQGVMRLLSLHGIDPAGRHAVVIGRSRIVGRPMAALLLQNDATVTICHSRTEDLAEHTRRADIIVAAAGRAGLVTADMVKDGAVIVDVGTNRGGDGGLVGDVDFDAVAPRSGAISPVPGGVGPMTIAMLLNNTYEAARWIVQGSLQSVSTPDI